MTTVLEQMRRDKANIQEPGDEGILDAMACSDAWQDAWLRAVARAWEDATFKQLLLTDSAAAFDSLGWTLPVGLVLNVKEYDGEHSYQPDVRNPNAGGDGEKVYVNGWTHMRAELAGEVTVILPPAPPVAHRAMALIDFQASGKVYPFTS